MNKKLLHDEKPHAISSMEFIRIHLFIRKSTFESQNKFRKEIKIKEYFQQNKAKGIFNQFNLSLSILKITQLMLN